MDLGQGSGIYTGPLDPSIALVGGGLLPGRGGAGSLESIEIEPAGRGFFETCNYNVGSSYIAATLLGGSYGLIEGVRNAPNRRARILLNSILNHCGKRGSRLGNGVAMLALMYSTAEYLADQNEVAVTLNVPDEVNSVVAGAVTGMLYKSTAGPRAVAAAGLLGAALAGGYWAAMELVFDGEGIGRAGFLRF
eukprot:PLAT668.1.p1 GENE.PLAT668.1~~PLAT668.1.p1  ORF type:complete len:192 (+),score=72.19 PLAT668.1:90-665(+)